MISYNNAAPKAVNNVGQFGATEGSIGAYKSAAEYAADAKYWALLSQTKYNSIEGILAEVERLYTQGRLLEEDINQLKADFETQQQTLLGLIQSTETAIDNANAATELSKEATQAVLAQLDIISNMTIQTTLLPPGSMATGSYDNSTGVFSFGIPEGQPGRDGTDGSISDIGDVAVGVPVSDDYGFYVDKEDGGLYRANMSDIANLIPSIRSISINGGAEQTGAISFNSVSSFNTRTGDVVPQAGDYDVSQITGAASSGDNSDITSLSGLTTAVSISQGGTGATTPEGSRTNLGLGTVAVEDVVPLGKGGTGATTAAAARTSLGLGLVSTESIVPIAKGGTGSTSAENARLALVAAKSGVNSDITSMTNGVTFTQPVSVADAVDATNAVNLGQISSDQGASLIGTLEGVPVQNIISNINTDIIQLKLNWAVENGYSDAGFTFTTGGTLTVDDRDKVVYDPASKTWYSYSGTLPVIVPAGFNPVDNADWKPQTDPYLRDDLADVGGFKLIGQVPDVSTLRLTEPDANSQRILLREYTAGTGYGGGQLRAVLDGSSYTDNGVTVFKTTGGAAWIRVNADIVNPLMAGAVPDGITPCSSAINAMFAVGKRMQFTGGDYLLDATITLQAGRSVDFGASRLIQGASLANYILAVRGADTHTSGGFIVGTGVRAGANSVVSAVLVADTSYSSVKGMTVRRVPGSGIQMVNCTRCKIQDCISENNWGMGLEDRYGTFNEVINSISNSNGYLSDTEINATGRGCLIWKSTGTIFKGNQTFSNSEYGIRVYSQSGDDAPTRYIHIIDHIAGDNQKIDIYVYNDSGNLLGIELTNCHVHRWNQSFSGSPMVALQGQRCHFNGGSLTKYGDIYDSRAIQCSNGDNIIVENVSINNVTHAFGNSANNTIFRNCATYSSTITDASGGSIGVAKYEGIDAVHAGAGTSDYAITVTAACDITNVTFQGFARNISWNNESLTIRDCRSFNTTGDAIRMYGDGVGVLQMSGNRWDVATVPAWLGSLVKQGSALPVLYDTAAPTTLTWPRGSKCVNSTPTVGSPKGWVCTVAGTPGTWVSEGNL